MRRKEEVLNDAKICCLNAGCDGCSYLSKDGTCLDYSGNLDKEIIGHLESNLDYNNGMNDAWEIAREVCRMDGRDFCDCFKCDDIDTVFMNNTADEIREIIKKYKEKNKIIVGDIVYYNGIQGMVIDIEKDMLRLLNENRIIEFISCLKVTKTGKHIDLNELFDIVFYSNFNI